MPGLVGMLTKKPRDFAEAEVCKMTAALRHEKFYTCGTWSDPDLGLYAGWVARQDSFASRMPLRTACGEVTLLFAGEDYPKPEALARLRADGHAFDPEGAGYLPYLYEGDATAFLRDLNGRFHGLLADRRQGVATLFNDRYGMHRLYCHESGGDFYFAAEAKAILAVRPELRSLDARGLGELVSFGCVVEDRTLFRGIGVLPPASAWTLGPGAIEKRETFFRPQEWETLPALDRESYYGELRRSVVDAVPRYFRGQEPMAVALTGGLDTRVLMAWQRAAAGSLPCYTYGGMVRDCHDVRIGRMIARMSGHRHEVIRAGREMQSRFAHYAERSVYLTDGCVDVSNAPDLYLSEQARGIAPAKLVGTWGSEILREAITFKPAAPEPGLFQPEFLSCIDQARQTYGEVRLAHPVTFAAFRQSCWSHFGIFALEQTQVTVRAPFLDNGFVRAAYGAPRPPGKEDPRLRLVFDGNPALAAVPSDRGVGGDGGPLAEGAARLLQNFTFKAEYAYDYGMPQWLARLDHLLAPARLERHFLGRHKFLHFRCWYRDELAGYVQQMLLDPRTLSRPYLNRRKVESIVRGHLRGDRNYTWTIHKLLTLELIHRQFS